MSSLLKHGNSYLSIISVRVGKASQGKRKRVYVKLSTDKYKTAKKRNAIVTREEHKIRKEILTNRATKSDLLNINDNVDWEWLKQDGSRTSIKLHTLSEYVNSFIKHKTIQKKRPNTISAYKFSLVKFKNAVGSNFLVSDIAEEHIDIFIDYMEQENLALSSIDSHLKSVQAFLNWCERRRYLDKAPLIELFRPVLDDKWLTENEYQMMLDYNYHDERFPKMFKLYAETGMRLSEGFYGVLTEDNNGIWLAIPNEASKSGKGRTIQLNQEQSNTIQLIQGLWLKSGYKIDHIKYYSKIFKRVRNELGIDSNKTFHSLRHYFGKTMVTITGNIYQVSGLMGHSSVKVTEDSYVKGFDLKSTLRDFPSLKPFLNGENGQKSGVVTQKWLHNEQEIRN